MLKQLRTTKGISAKFVADKLGMDRATLAKIEKGKTDLPTKCLPMLSYLYGVSEEVIKNAHIGDLEND